MLGGGEKAREEQNVKQRYLLVLSGKVQFMWLCSYNKHKRKFLVLNPCKHSDPEQCFLENCTCPGRSGAWRCCTQESVCYSYLT